MPEQIPEYEKFEPVEMSPLNKFVHFCISASVSLTAAVEIGDPYIPIIAIAGTFILYQSGIFTFNKLANGFFIENEPVEHPGDF